MATPDPIPLEPRRFSIGLPRPLCIGLAMVVLAGAGLAVGLPLYWQQVAVPAADLEADSDSRVEADFSSLTDLIAPSDSRVRRPSGDNQLHDVGLFAIGIFAVGFAVAALAIWLMVRIVNCRRKISAAFWAVGVLAMIVAYPVSFGPACWVNERTNANTRLITVAFYPIIRLANRSSRVSAVVLWYAGLGARAGSTPSFDKDKIEWIELWEDVGDAGHMVPYRAIISCFISAESGDWRCEVSADETEDGADETE